MPGYKTHLGGAGVAAFFLLTATHWSLPTASLICPRTIWCISASLLGGLFPDIDIKSKGQKIFYMLLFIVLGFALIAKDVTIISICSILAVIPPLLPHRGLTHKPLFIIAVPFALPLVVATYHPAHTSFSLTIYMYFITGALSHLVLDFSSKKRLLKLFYKGRR